MNQRSLKVLVACALGAGIGTLVSLQIHHYLWWIGLIVGGLVGYFSYEFKAVLQALVRAWKATIGWRPDTRKIPRFVETVFWNTASASNFVLPIILIWILILRLGGTLEKGSAILDLKTFYEWLFLSFSVSLGFAVFVAIREYFEDKDFNVAESRAMGLKVNPVTLYFFCVPVRILFGCVWLLCRVHLPFVAGAKILRHSFLTCGRFGWYFFRLIHSDIRLLCGLDAMIGAVVGYFTGSVLIGAAVGGIVGVLNFEIVSKRIFNLVPVANNS